MKNSNIIFYSPGAYGHFINWCCDYFSGYVDSDIVPVNDVGNCHNYHNARNMTIYPSFKNYTESESDVVYPFIQIHENSFEDSDSQMISDGNFVDVVVKNLTYLKENYIKSIYIYPTETSKIWITNNYIYKIRMSDWFGVDGDDLARNYLESLGAPTAQVDQMICYGDDRLKKLIESQYNITKNLTQWGHSNINEFADWELREFSSEYFYDRMTNSIISSNIINQLVTQFPNIYFISLDNLRDNFVQTISNILTHFDVKNVHNWDKINNIHQTWLSKQAHINKDSRVAEIVTALLTNKTLDWQDWNLTIIDELSIQRLLSDNHVSINCWNLNKFPTNTWDLLPLLEKK